MIDWWQALLLALIQGLTEFLPISSSAHLVIPSLILGWPDQGLAFDVAVHVGTLSAVLVYYRSDLVLMLRGAIATIGGAPADENTRLLGYIILATIPVGLVGVLAGDFIEAELRNLPVIATTTLLFGLLLGLADRKAARGALTTAPTLTAALAIGLAQAIAPVPGVSRSGVTITAALLLGMNRQGAARFSFLLSMPVIASAGLLKLWQLLSGDYPVDWFILGLGVVVSGLTAYSCIALFLRLLDRIGLMPFVYYRLVLAVLLYVLWLA